MFPLRAVLTSAISGRLTAGYISEFVPLDFVELHAVNREELDTNVLRPVRWAWTLDKSKCVIAYGVTIARGAAFSCPLAVTPDAGDLSRVAKSLPRGGYLMEALLTTLAVAFVAGLVVTVIGIAIGFRQKRWLLAIVSGSITCVLLVVFTIVGESTGLLDEPAGEQVLSTQVAAPAPEPTLAQPVGGFGISRDAIHEVLTSSFGYGRIKEENCPITFCTSIESPNPNVKVWLFGDDDSVYRALVNGDTRENDTATGEAMAVLANIVAPESSDRIVDWILTDAVESLDRKGGGGIETTVIGGRDVELAVSKSSGGLSFSINE